MACLSLSVLNGEVRVCGSIGSSSRLPAWALPPNGVMAKGARSISEAELALVRSAYAASEFWKVPAADPSPGATSTAWLLEARVGPRYRGVVRQALPGAYRAAGLVLMELAGIGEAELAPDAPGVIFAPAIRPGFLASRRHQLRLRRHRHRGSGVGECREISNRLARLGDAQVRGTQARAET